MEICLPSDIKVFPFASDDFGNCYLVDLTSPCLPVSYYDHDGGDVLQVADKLETFLNWERYEDSRRLT